MKIYVIGIGLIGGSMGLDLKKTLNDIEIIGIDTNKIHLDDALSLGIIDRIGSLESITEADRVILSIPVKESMHLLPELLDKIHADALIWDVGSTKEQLCKLISSHPKRDQFLAAHPIAGLNFRALKLPTKACFRVNHRYYVSPIKRALTCCCGQNKPFVKWECTCVLWKQKNTTSIWHMFLIYHTLALLC